MRALLRTLSTAAVLVCGLVGWSGEAAAQSGFVATVTAESTDLHRNAGAASPVIDTVLRGTKMPAFGVSPDKRWVRVRAPGGDTVWIARTAVKVTRGDAGGGAATARTRRPAATPAPRRSGGDKPMLAHVVVDRTRVQFQATKGSPTIQVAKRGDQFDVAGFSRDGAWVKVRTGDSIGWVLKTDLRPGPGKAVASAPPKQTPKDDFDDPNAGFSDTPPERERPRRDDPPPRRRRRVATASDMSVWADAGLVLIDEKVTSREGHGYSLHAMGYGAGVQFERRMSGSIFLEGGYLGTANQRIPAPESSTTVFSTLHRIDVSARYKYFLFNGDEEGPQISATAGIQNYSFLVQPQNLSWFYSQIYNSGSVGIGGEYPYENYRGWVDLRYLAPVLASQRYGSGSKGGDGQGSSSTGYAIGIGARYHFYSGASLGLSYRGHFYETQFTGVGKRGPNEVHGVRVKDSFQAITLTYARGF